jgi:hypothetical protein
MMSLGWPAVTSAEAVAFAAKMLSRSGRHASSLSLEINYYRCRGRAGRARQYVRSESVQGE